MKKFSKLLCLAMSATMVISLAACGSSTKSETVKPDTSSTSSSTEKVKIKFLSLSADDNRNKIRENYIKKNLEKDMPNVEVEYDLGGGGQDYYNKLKTYNASGDLPDVWFSEQNLSLVVLNSGNCLDLTPYVKKEGFDQNFTMKEVIAPWKDGKIYCLQPGADQYATPRLFYHKDMFTKNNIQIPKTFDELLTACKTLKDKGVIPMSIVGKDGWSPNLHMLQTMMMIEDPNVVVDLVNNKTDFKNPVVKNAIGRIQKLVQVGAFDPGVTNVDYGPAMEQFTSNKSAMLAMFTWELPGLEKQCKDLDYMLWPSAKEGVDTSASIQYWGAPLSGYLVSKATKNPEVAAKFAMYCTKQDALFYNTDNKAPTAYNTGIKLDGMSDLAKKNFDQFSAAKLKVPSLWSAVYDTKLSAEIATADSKLLTGQYSPDDFVKTINPLWLNNGK